MNGAAGRFLRLGVSLSGLVVLGWVLTGQAARPADEGLPTDWSHNHVIFSQPGSDDQARLIGADPRYWQQVHRREQSLVVRAEESDTASARLLAARGGVRGGLWSENLGPGATAGAANFPAKYSFSITTANCGTAPTPDYVVYSTGLSGSGTQADIVAFDNLYSGCGGTVPSVYWTYNTGGQVLTSPVLSLDGTQIAFVQTNAAKASMVLLKWKASTTETVSLPGVPTLAASAALYRTCVAPCMWLVALHNGSGVAVDDTTSSPFYDYTNDIAWVGGANGWLHKVTGIFKGTPTEVVTGGFPVQVKAASTNALSDPVYDRISQNVFVGDAGGFFYRIPSVTGTTAVATSQLDFGAGLVESPILDQTNGHLFVFASSDGTTSCGGVACSAIYTLSTTFAAGTAGLKVTVGTSVAKGTLPNPNPLYSGGFDSAYYSAVGGSGNLYVCGNTGADPTLYRVPVTSGVFGAAVAVAALTPAARTPSCSPVTDFLNSGTRVANEEYAFFSVQNYGRPCGNKGCLMNFITMPWKAQTPYVRGDQIMVLRTASNILYIQTAVGTGITGTTIPVWSPIVGLKTTDGSVTWLNQGVTTATALGGWTANATHGLQARILDSNANVEIATVAGRSGGAAPAWSTIPGGNTADGTITWINAGPWPNAGLSITLGTGGIIIDNAVSSTTLAGASQVYFFTLGNEPCFTSGTTGGCAMQASQTSLQ